MPKEVLEFPLLGQEETYITAGHRYLVVVPNSGPIPVRATSRHHIICQNGAQVWLAGWGSTSSSRPSSVHPELVRVGGVGTVSQDISCCKDTHTVTGRCEGSIPCTV